jgi:hypothetical protein
MAKLIENGALTGSVDEEGSSTELLNGPERDRSRADINEGGNERDQEGVADGSEILEERGTEVEDEVDTLADVSTLTRTLSVHTTYGKLLHHLDRSTEDSLSEIGSGVPQSTRETSGPGSEVTTLGHEFGLVLVVGDDLGEFLGDVVRVGGLSTNSSKGSGSLVNSTLLDEPSRGLGEEEKTGSEDHTGH